MHSNPRSEDRKRGLRAQLGQLPDFRSQISLLVLKMTFSLVTAPFAARPTLIYLDSAPSSTVLNCLHITSAVEHLVSIRFLQVHLHVRQSCSCSPAPRPIRREPIHTAARAEDFNASFGGVLPAAQTDNIVLGRHNLLCESSPLIPMPLPPKLIGMPYLFTASAHRPLDCFPSQPALLRPPLPPQSSSMIIGATDYPPPQSRPTCLDCSIRRFCTSSPILGGRVLTSSAIPSAA